MGEIVPYSCWDGVSNEPPGDEELDSLLSNILDFPIESLEGDGCVANWDASKSDYLGPIPSDVLVGPSFARNGPEFLRTKVPDAPYIDVATPKPKQLSYHFEDNSGPFIGLKNKCKEVQEQTLFHSQSPVSVLESGAPSLAGKNPIVKAHVCKRARSKRARPLGLGPWISVSLPSVDPSLSRKTPKSRERRKKPSPLSPATKRTIEAKNPSQLSDCVELQNNAARPSLTKKCTHCEITKTPQWREGPLGPKTLCNACGVRYRSGRLYPEYRPAASPTFVPSLHSNSHRKVIEMRNRGKQQTTDGIKFTDDRGSHA